MAIKYEKPVMTMTQLLRMGFTRVMLDRAFNYPNQTFAWRADPSKRGSTKMFDTAGFERWRQEQAKLERI